MKKNYSPDIVRVTQCPDSYNLITYEQLDRIALCQFNYRVIRRLQ